jgi:hypothetical protein
MFSASLYVGITIDTVLGLLGETGDCRWFWYTFKN